MSVNNNNSFSAPPPYDGTDHHTVNMSEYDKQDIISNQVACSVCSWCTLFFMVTFTYVSLHSYLTEIFDFMKKQ